jgi:hypothetical protein
MLISLVALACVGCETTTPDWGKYRGQTSHSHEAPEYKIVIINDSHKDPHFLESVETLMEAKSYLIKYREFHDDLYVYDSNDNLILQSFNIPSFKEQIKEQSE